MELNNYYVIITNLLAADILVVNISNILLLIDYR